MLAQIGAVSSSDTALPHREPRAGKAPEAAPLLILKGDGRSLGGIALTRP